MRYKRSTRSLILHPIHLISNIKVRERIMSFKGRKPTHTPGERSIGALEAAPKEVDHPTSSSSSSSSSLALLGLRREFPVPRLDPLLLQCHWPLHLVVTEGIIYRNQKERMQMWMKRWGAGPCGIPENTGIPGLDSNTDTGIFENIIPVFFGIFV